MLSKEEIEKIKAGQENAKKAGSKKMKLQPMTLKTLEKLNNVEEGEASPLMRSIGKESPGAHTDIIKCCVSDASGLIVSGSYDKTAKIWTVKDGANVISLEAHKKQVNAVAMNSGRIVTGGHDKQVILWRARDGYILKLFNGGTGTAHTDSVTGVAFKDDAVSWKAGRTVAGGGGNTMGKIMDMQTVISCSMDSTIKVWDAKTGLCTATLEGHEGGVTCCGVADRRVVSGGEDQTVRVWDIFNGACLQILEAHTGFISAVAIDQGLIASASKDASVIIWQAETGILLHTLKTKGLVISKEDDTVLQEAVTGHKGPVNSLAFKDGLCVSGGSDELIIVWHAGTGKSLATLKGHSRGVDSLSLHAGILTSCSADNTIKIWTLLGCNVQIEKGMSVLERYDRGPGPLQADVKHAVANGLSCLANGQAADHEDITDANMAMMELTTGNFLEEVLKEIYKDYKDMSLGYIQDAMKEAAKADKEIPHRAAYKNCRIAMLEMRFRYMEKVVAAGKLVRYYVLFEFCIRFFDAILDILNLLAVVSPVEGELSNFGSWSAQGVFMILTIPFHGAILLFWWTAYRQFKAVGNRAPVSSLAQYLKLSTPGMLVQVGFDGFQGTCQFFYMADSGFSWVTCFSMFGSGFTAAVVFYLWLYLGKLPKVESWMTKRDAHFSSSDEIMALLIQVLPQAVDKMWNVTDLVKLLGQRVEIVGFPNDDLQNRGLNGKVGKCLVNFDTKKGLVYVKLDDQDFDDPPLVLNPQNLDLEEIEEEAYDPLNADFGDPLEGEKVEGEEKKEEGGGEDDGEKPKEKEDLSHLIKEEKPVAMSLDQIEMILGEIERMNALLTQFKDRYKREAPLRRKQARLDRMAADTIKANEEAAKAQMNKEPVLTGPVTLGSPPGTSA